MPATIGATVRRPKAGSVQNTSGNSRSTGRRRARVSADRRLAERASSPSRWRVAASGVPLRTWSTSARTSGRAASPHDRWSAESASVTGTPRSMDTAARPRSSRVGSGAHRARIGSADGTVCPAETSSTSRSIRSGRSSGSVDASSARARRNRRQRRSTMAPATTLDTRIGSRTAIDAAMATPAPSRASASGRGGSPPIVRSRRPRATSGRCRGTIRRRSRRATARPLRRRPPPITTAATAASATASAVTRPVPRAGASTAPRRGRGCRPPPDTPSPPVWPARTAPTWGRR